MENEIVENEITKESKESNVLDSLSEINSIKNGMLEVLNAQKAKAKTLEILEKELKEFDVFVKKQERERAAFLQRQEKAIQAKTKKIKELKEKIANLR